MSPGLGHRVRAAAASSTTAPPHRSATAAPLLVAQDTDWGSVYQFEVNATCGEYTVTLVADVAYWNNETYVSVWRGRGGRGRWTELGGAVPRHPLPPPHLARPMHALHTERRSGMSRWWKPTRAAFGTTTISERNSLVAVPACLLMIQPPASHPSSTPRAPSSPTPMRPPLCSSAVWWKKNDADWWPAPPVSRLRACSSMRGCALPADCLLACLLLKACLAGPSSL